MIVNYLNKKLNVELLIPLYVLVPYGILSFFNSSILVHSFRIIILILFITYNKKINKNLIILIMFLIVIYSFDLLKNINSFNVVISHLLFMLYLCVPLIVMASKITNYNYIFHNFYKLSKIVLYFNLYILFFLNGSKNNYMDFGIKVTLPLMFILFKYKESIYNYVTCYLGLFTVFFYANRSSFLIVILYFFIKIIENQKKKIIILIILFSILIYFKIEIYNYILKILEENDIYSYSYTKLGYIIKGKNLEKLSSGRGELLEEALRLIYEKPFFGGGTSYFINNQTIKKGNYPHNIILQLILEYGILSIFIIIVFLFKVYQRYYSVKNIYFKELILILLIAQIRLLFSGEYQEEGSLFLIIGIVFFNKLKNMKKYKFGYLNKGVKKNENILFFSSKA